MWFAIFLIFLSVDQNLGQHSCQLRNSNKSGICIPIRECPTIWDVVKNAPRPLDQRTLQFLRESICGNIAEQRVCCRSDVAQPPLISSPSTQRTGIELHPNYSLLDLKHCGINNHDRISYGNITELQEFPWMALLGYSNANGIEWRCGGSVITARYVLTAAHCLHNLRSDTRLSVVRLGEYDISKRVDCVKRLAGETLCNPPVQDIPVERQIVHPAYDKQKYVNDIAMIRLARNADFSGGAVTPICLPVTRKFMNAALKKLIVTGWGTTETQFKSDVLLKATMVSITSEECERRVRVKPAGGQLCAQGAKKQDTCKV